MLEADGANAEMMYLDCRRYGIFNYVVPESAERKTFVHLEWNQHGSRQTYVCGADRP
jgi:hypothetical protein